MTPLFAECCLPFQLDNQDMKGRLVRLGPSVDHILKTHNYPIAISRQLGKALAMAGLLGSMMKFNGILTIQVRAEGTMPLLVSDFATDGSSNSGVLRGYAQFDPEIAVADDATLSDLVEKAYMVITIDQGQYTDRYQGIVELNGENLSHGAENYFQSSEQLPSAVHLSCDQDKDGNWTAGGIMIQHLAVNTEAQQKKNIDEESGFPEDENWNRAKILMSSLKDEELLDQALSLQDVLFRLYHEDGVRVFEESSMTNGCRCSEAKLRSVLNNFDPADLKDMAENGIIKMVCEFCKTEHRFELNKLMN